MKFNREILALARESRGYTQVELSKKLNVEQGTISKIENGQLSFPDDLINELVSILGYPKDLFFKEKSVIPVRGHYRKKITLPVKELKEYKGTMTFSEWQIETLINAVDLPNPNIPSWDVEMDGSPIEAAIFVRDYWKIPRGRIADLAKIMEDNGIIIVPLELGNMDALATYSIENNLPIIYINKNRPADRIRFNLAHELCHYVCHFGKKISADREEKDIELEAQEFASELLLPKAELIPQLGKVNLDKLGELKRYWKVSMQAILVKAYKSGAISQNQYHYLFKQMSMLGYRKNEPIEVEFDKPSLLQEIIDTYINELDYSKDSLAQLLFLTNEELDERYFGIKQRFKTKLFIR